MNRRGKPITGPDGVDYPSKAALARSLGVHPCTINWHLDRVGHLNHIGMMGGTPVSKGRRKWPSVVVAARDLGCSPSLIHQHLRIHGHLENLGKWGGRRYSRPLRIGPVEWPARVDACRDLGITKPTLAEWLSPDASPAQREKLMAGVMRISAQREMAAHVAARGAERAAEAELGEFAARGSRKSQHALSGQKTEG